MTDLAGDINIRQEVHLDFDETVSGAGLAAPALDIEGKTPRFIPAQLRVLRRCKQVADIGEKTRIRRRIRARRPADRALVDVDDLVEVCKTRDAVRFSRAYLPPVQLRAEGFLDNLRYQARLAAAGHAGDAGDRSQRDIHVDAFEIVFRSAFYGQEVPVPLPACFRDRDPFRAAEVLSRNGVRAGHDRFGRARADDRPSVHTRAGADVHDPVRRADGVLVMLYDDERVADIGQVAQRAQELFVIALVQADARLVENIQNAHKGGADLRGKADALALAPGKGRRAARKRQVSEPNADKKAQPLVDLLDDAVCDHRVLLGQLERADERARLRDGHTAEFSNIESPHRDGEHLFFQPVPMAVQTGILSHAVFQL